MIYMLALEVIHIIYIGLVGGFTCDTYVGLVGGYTCNILYVGFVGGYLHSGRSDVQW